MLDIENTTRMRSMIEILVTLQENSIRAFVRFVQP